MEIDQEIQKVTCSPIALFVYNRPIHTRQTVEALLANVEAVQTALYVFSDAPRDVAASRAVAEVRSYVRSIAGFKSVTIIERETNFGLARSIIDGVTRLCEEHGRAIVVEDDLLVASSFLNFMNTALDKYEHVDRVMHVTGHIFEVPEFAERNEALFFPLTPSWGWATWASAWRLFDPKVEGWEFVLSDRATRRRFDLDGNSAFSIMLKQQMRGEIDSWAIRWYFSVFKNHGLSVLPPSTLVQNIGFGSGTHGSLILNLRQKFKPKATVPEGRSFELPDEVGFNPQDLKNMYHAQYVQTGRWVGWMYRFLREKLSRKFPEV